VIGPIDIPYFPFREFGEADVRFGPILLQKDFWSRSEEHFFRIKPE
jgi:hypothetical protein